MTRRCTVLNGSFPRNHLDKDPFRQRDRQRIFCYLIRDHLGLLGLGLGISLRTTTRIYPRELSNPPLRDSFLLPL